MLISFLFHNENICCGYSLEVPRWGTSNEYHNICFHYEIRKILCGYPLLSVVMSILILYHHWIKTDLSMHWWYHIISNQHKCMCRLILPLAVHIWHKGPFMHYTSYAVTLFFESEQKHLAENIYLLLQVYLCLILCELTGFGCQLLCLLFHFWFRFGS